MAFKEGTYLVPKHVISSIGNGADTSDKELKKVDKWLCDKILVVNKKEDITFYNPYNLTQNIRMIVKGEVVLNENN